MDSLRRRLQVSVRTRLTGSARMSHRHAAQEAREDCVCTACETKNAKCVLMMTAWKCNCPCTACRATREREDVLARYERRLFIRAISNNQHRTPFYYGSSRT